MLAHVPWRDPNDRETLLSDAVGAFLFVLLVVVPWACGVAWLLGWV